MKRVTLSPMLIADVLGDHNHCCKLCGINVTVLTIAMRNMPSSYDRLNSGPVKYAKRDRFTQASPQGALLGRHKDRAHTLLGRMWGITLWPGCHFHEIDHIVPVAEGGRNVASNLRLLCRRCHKGVSVELMKRLRKRPSKGVGRGF